MTEVQQIAAITVFLGIVVVTLLFSFSTMAFLINQKKQALQVMARGPIIILIFAIIIATITTLCFDMIVIIRANELSYPGWLKFIEEQVPTFIQKTLALFTITGLSVIVTYLIIAASVLFILLCLTIYINWWLITRVPNSANQLPLSRTTQMIIGMLVVILVLVLAVNWNIIGQFFAIR